jgi:SAM-dependent methyltransferase
VWGGVAVELVAARLDDGSITAIDRSARAIERARRRNVANGRAVFDEVDLARFGGEPSAFDKAFAVNVNVFWTKRADAECVVLDRVLRPGGVVHLVYDGTRDVSPAVAANLERHGFEVEVRRGEFLCVTGRRWKRQRVAPYGSVAPAVT